MWYHWLNEVQTVEILSYHMLICQCCGRNLDSLSFRDWKQNIAEPLDKTTKQWKDYKWDRHKLYHNEVRKSQRFEYWETKKNQQIVLLMLWACFVKPIKKDNCCVVLIIFFWFCSFQIVKMLKWLLKNRIKKGLKTLKVHF